MRRKVAVVVGSDSDLPVAFEGTKVLEEFGVEYEIRVLSAHRTPDDAAGYAGSASENGFGVIVAGAGLSAHLAGVIAAHTLLPVVGVPLAAGALNGVDALYSVVQMPSGVPVACVGIGAFKNAALLAVRILALTDVELERRLHEHRHNMQEAVLQKDAMLQQKGIQDYLRTHTTDN